MQISLNEAIQVISDTLFLLDDKKDFPYFFIVGAGISMPEIPSASRIIEICKNKVKERGEDAYNFASKKSSSHIKNPMLYYSSWIESAFPNPINRSQFYKTLIMESKISSANLMLAQILQANKISRTIFTTNFDDKIKQALEIIGTRDVFISENAMDNLVVNINSPEIQIVHVHGTYRFYDSANLEKEINNVSEQTGTISSFQVLRNFLQQKAPIVVGYSGWENDVVMTCIKERISLPVPYNYIWVCFSQNDYNSLPDWLKCSDRVCFVIPTKPESKCDEDDIDINIFLSQKGKDKVSEIPATLFFGKLISQLRILPPKIFVNPYGYYSEMIANTLPHNEDVLHLKHWAERMRYFAKNDTPIDIKIRELELASISKNFEKASEIITSLGQVILTEPDIDFLCNTIIAELLDDERIIKTVDAKIRLSTAILEFAKKHYNILLSSNSLNKLLNKVLNIRFKTSERNHLEHVLNTVYELSVDNEELIDVHLTSIGIKSSIAKDDCSKLELLNELLKKYPNNTNRKSLKYKKYLALLNKCELIDEIEAIELYSQAEQLLGEINIDELHIRLLKCKAEVALKIKEPILQIKWATECLDSALISNSKECKYEILKIVECLTSLKSERLIKIENIIEKVNSLLNETYECNCDEENCENILSIAKIYLSLTHISSKDNLKMEYCQKIIALKSKLPHECGQFQLTLLLALSELCIMSTLFIPDDVKIEYLLNIKKIVSTHNLSSSMFNSILNIASKLGDEEKYLKSELSEDLKNLEIFDTLDKAMDAYREKNFFEAESMFKSLLNTNILEIRENAFNNLAFMVRRGETLDKYSFIELIEIVSDSYVFKHMNTILYYLQKGTVDLERCKQSYKMLQEISQDDIEHLTQCWGDFDLVGEESVIGMIIIRSLSGDEKIDLGKLTPSLMNTFNLEILKELIS